MIPFNKPHLTGKEIEYISAAHARGQLAGDGYFTKKCNTWLEETTGCHKALLTHSCTAALEMAAILADIQPGDELSCPLTPLCLQQMLLCFVVEFLFL